MVLQEDRPTEVRPNRQVKGSTHIVMSLKLGYQHCLYLHGWLHCPAQQTTSESGGGRTVQTQMLKKVEDNLYMMVSLTPLAKDTPPWDEPGI